MSQDDAARAHPRRAFELETIASSEARRSFSEIVSRVQYAGDYIIVERQGKPAAAIVPVEDALLLQKLYDAADAASAQQALQNALAFTGE